MPFADVEALFWTKNQAEATQCAESHLRASFSTRRVGGTRNDVVGLVKRIRVAYMLPLQVEDSVTWPVEDVTMQHAPLIAIINDDPAFLEFIASFLEDETRYQTVVWDDGVDSLPKLREHEPELVILDVRLGDQAVGYQILETMRQEEQLVETPVIICTADTNFIREHAELISSLHADVLEKPFDLEVLEDKVGSALERRLISSEEADPVG